MPFVLKPEFEAGPRSLSLVPYPPHRPWFPKGETPVCRRQRSATDARLFSSPRAGGIPVRWAWPLIPTYDRRCCWGPRLPRLSLLQVALGGTCHHHHRTDGGWDVGGWSPPSLTRLGFQGLTEALCSSIPVHRWAFGGGHSGSCPRRLSAVPNPVLCE